MIDNFELEQILIDIDLFEYEKSFAYIGCARWGKTYWYDEEKPDISGHEQDIKNFIYIISKFALDFKQGTPTPLSTLYVFPREKPNRDECETQEAWEEWTESYETSINFRNSRPFKTLLSMGVLLQPSQAELEMMPNESDLILRSFTNIDQKLFETLIDFFNSVPGPLSVWGKFFLCFKDYVIELTWHGWAVYARRHADVGFVRWFFTLTTRLCNMNIALLHDFRAPLLDDYNPLWNQRGQVD